jgi:uracil phosphoribosyltransferase
LSRIQLDYLAAPSLQNREVILIDPMLATGNSVIRSVAALLKHGKPSHIYVASLVAAPEGVKNINEHQSVASSLFTEPERTRRSVNSGVASNLLLVIFFSLMII